MNRDRKFICGTEWSNFDIVKGKFVGINKIRWIIHEVLNNILCVDINIMGYYFRQHMIVRLREVANQKGLKVLNIFYLTWYCNSLRRIN